MNKREAYAAVREKIAALVGGESDAIALMATISCELFHHFDSFDWVGFYRHVGDRILKVGPYHGGHGCLTIPFARGICGKCATTRQTQIVPDVNALPEHIACSSSTQSEIVLPIFDAQERLIAVLDIDSDQPAAFDETDGQHLAEILRVFRETRSLSPTASP